MAMWHAARGILVFDAKTQDHHGLRTWYVARGGLGSWPKTRVVACQDAKFLAAGGPTGRGARATGRLRCILYHIEVPKATTNRHELKEKKQGERKEQEAGQPTGPLPFFVFFRSFRLSLFVIVPSFLPGKQDPAAW